MLGHASAAMTLDTYADLFPDDLDAVASALSESTFSENWGQEMKQKRRRREKNRFQKLWKPGLNCGNTGRGDRI